MSVLHDKVPGGRARLSALVVDAYRRNSCGQRARGTRASTLLIVSTQRDQLHRLIDELPEEQVADALALLRARRSRGRRGWPPRWFGAVQAGRSDTAQRAEEILRDGFGRSA